MTLVAMLPFFGCSLLTPTPAEPKRALLDKLPADLPKQSQTSATLLILPPETEPIYDTTQMAYSKSAYEIGYFNEYQWAERPSRMIQTLLAATFRNTGYFSNVALPPDFSHHDFTLNTRITTFRQEFTISPPRFHAVMELELLDRNGKTLTAKTVEEIEPIAGTGPYQGVVAANNAVARLLRQVTLAALESAKRERP